MICTCMNAGTARIIVRTQGTPDTRAGLSISHTYLFDGVVGCAVRVVGDGVHARFALLLLGASGDSHLEQQGFFSQAHQLQGVVRSVCLPASQKQTALGDPAAEARTFCQTDTACAATVASKAAPAGCGVMTGQT
jgi:hypothetical protein